MESIRFKFTGISFLLAIVSSLFVYLLTLELVFLSNRSWWAIILFFLFGFFYFLRTTKKPWFLVVSILFLLISINLVGIYSVAPQVHFLILGLGLAFFALNYIFKTPEKRVSQELYSLLLLLIIFETFTIYFSEGFGGVVFSSIILLLFLAVIFGAKLHPLPAVYIFCSTFVLLEIGLVLNFLSFPSELKALLPTIGYFIIAKLKT